MSVKIFAMDFGIFLGPWHTAGQDPTLALERDLELVQRLDQLGYHEAWIGEHHSCIPPNGVLGCRHCRTQGVAKPASLGGGRLDALPSN